MSKLDPLVPTRRRRQREVHAATATLADLPSTDARLLGRLAQHCRQASRLAFEYRSAQDAVTQREVEAQHLVNYGRRWYLCLGPGAAGLAHSPRGPHGCRT